MRMEHLSSSDYEKYMDTTELSDEYLMWLEPVAEHLSQCEECQHKLQKIMKIEYICEEGAIGISELIKREDDMKKLVLTENIKAMYKASSDEEARMQQLIDKIKESLLEPVRRMQSQISETKPDWYKNAWQEYEDRMRDLKASRIEEAGMRRSAQACSVPMSSGRALYAPDELNRRELNGQEMDGRLVGKIKDISYEYGCLVIGVEAPREASSVTIILQGNNDEIMIEKAEVYIISEEYKGNDLWLARVKCDRLAEYYDIYIDIV